MCDKNSYLRECAEAVDSIIDTFYERIGLGEYKQGFVFDLVKQYIKGPDDLADTSNTDGTMLVWFLEPEGQKIAEAEKDKIAEEIKAVEDFFHSDEYLDDEYEDNNECDYEDYADLDLLEHHA